MTLAKFVSKHDILAKKELEKVLLLAFFHRENSERVEFTLSDVVAWFSEVGLARPNTSRLRTRLRGSPDFIKGNGNDRFRIHAKTLASLTASIGDGQANTSETIDAGEPIISVSLLANRGYMRALGEQINASYESNIFDGCAVLMRRLIEILLIHSFQHQGIEREICDANGDFLPLATIINKALSSPVMNLSKTTRECLDDFRKLGNFSAHAIHYTCKRNDIRRVIPEYRVATEELLYKAGLKT